MCIWLYLHVYNIYIYIYIYVCVYVSVYHYNVFVYVIDMYVYSLYLYLQANGGMSTVSLQTLALQGPFAATLGSLAAWEISFSRYISTYFRVFKKDNFLTSVLWFFYTSVFSEVPFWCLEFWIVLASSSSPCCRPSLFEHLPDLHELWVSNDEYKE